MDDTKLDLQLKAHFSEKFQLEDSLVAKTKLRLQQKAEARETKMLCAIQIGFWIMAVALAILAFVTVGVSTIVVLSIAGYLALVSLLGTVLA